MNPEPKGPEAARWRQRKFQAARQFHCHCAKGEGHPVWLLGFMSEGKHRVERIPNEWVDDVRRRVAAGRAFQDALREVLTANAELLVLRRKQQPR